MVSHREELTVRVHNTKPQGWGCGYPSHWGDFLPVPCATRLEEAMGTEVEEGRTNSQ